jgi:uncharacterized protein
MISSLSEYAIFKQVKRKHSMTLLHGVLLFVAALLAGTLNAVAGGGTFITVPMLIFVGVLPVNANATSTVALWPGYLASAGAYRQEFAQERARLISLGGISLLGGILGAVLLLHTPQHVFLRLLPFLLLVATLLFALGPQITALVRRNAPVAPGKPAQTLAPEQARTSGLVAGFLQLVVSIYGGFFGGGIGILMLSLLTVSGMTNIHAMNAVKTGLSFLINGVAVVLFIAARIVAWPYALVMLAGSLLGGYYGAFFARKLDPQIIRLVVIGVGGIVSVVLFAQAYL